MFSCLWSFLRTIIVLGSWGACGRALQLVFLVPVGSKRKNHFSMQFLLKEVFCGFTRTPFQTSQTGKEVFHGFTRTPFQTSQTGCLKLF